MFFVLCPDCDMLATVVRKLRVFLIHAREYLPMGRPHLSDPFPRQHDADMLLAEVNAVLDKLGQP